MDELNDLVWCKNMSGLAKEQIAEIDKWIETLSPIDCECLRYILKEQDAIKENELAAEKKRH